MGAEAPGEVSGPAPADSEGVAMQEVVVVEDVAAEHASQSCAPGSDDAPSAEQQEAPAGPKLVHAEPNGRAPFIRGRPSVSAGSGAWRVTLRRLMLPIYMPAFMYGMSESIVIPVLPIYILELGSTLDEVGALVSMNGLGALCTAGAAGIVASRTGEKIGMMSGCVVRAVGAVICALATAIASLFVARFFNGIGKSLFQVSRQSYIAGAVPNHHRGRVNALIGGVSRISNIVAPLIGGAMAEYISSISVFYTSAALNLVTVASMLIIGLPRWVGSPESAPAPKPSSPKDVAGAKGVGLDGWRAMIVPLCIVGVTGFSFMFVREARNILLPLKANELHLDKAGAGLVTAASYFFDAATFPAAGILMDRWGRKYAGVPALLLMALGIGMLPLAHSPPVLYVCSAVLGAGNGLSSGLVMTIGQARAFRVIASPAHVSPDGASAAAQDHAPPSQPDRSRFIGVFKMFTELASFAAPVVVGFVSHETSLDLAAIVVAAISGAGAAWYGWFGIETLRPGGSAKMMLDAPNGRSDGAAAALDEDEKSAKLTTPEAERETTAEADVVGSSANGSHDPAETVTDGGDAAPSPAK